MTSSREYSSLESPAKGTYLALNREFFSRGAETRGGREGRCQGATGCFGIDREQVFGEQGFVLNETCPGDRARERRGCTHHGDRPARECYPPPRERRRSPCGGLLTRAPAAGTRWEIDLELMARAVGPRTPAGARGGEGGHVVLSAVEGDTRWLDPKKWRRARLFPTSRQRDGWYRRVRK